MLNESKRYSRKHRYEIHPTKTNVVVVENEYKMTDNTTWALRGNSISENSIQVSDSSAHLGISRAEKGKEIIHNRNNLDQ